MPTKPTFLTNDSRQTTVEARVEGGLAWMDSVGGVSWFLEEQDVFLEVNAAYERMTGIARDKWVGRRIEEMQKLPDVPKQSATLQALDEQTHSVPIEPQYLHQIATATPKRKELAREGIVCQRGLHQCR